MTLRVAVVARPMLAVGFAMGAATAACSQEVFCGMGPPPGTPDFADRLRRQFAQEQMLGYQLVCEPDIERQLSNMRESSRPSADLPRLKFKPVDLENTPFTGFQKVSQVSENGETALVRSFRTPEGNYVELTEWDLSIDGGAAYSLDSRPPTEDVNGNPARLYVVQAPSGRALSLLTWTEGRRNYTLRIDVNAKVATRPDVLQLARAMPKSEAAGSRKSGFPGFPASIEVK